MRIRASHTRGTALPPPAKPACPARPLGAPPRLVPCSGRAVLLSSSRPSVSSVRNDLRCYLLLQASFMTSISLTKSKTPIFGILTLLLYRYLGPCLSSPRKSKLLVAGSRPSTLLGANTTPLQRMLTLMKS